MNGGEFLESESLYSIMAWHFPIWYFFSVVLSKSMCISAFGLSSSPNSFVILLIHLAFSLCSLVVAIFLSKIVWFLLHPVVGVFLCHLPPLVGRISFWCFGISCFVCIVLPFVNIFLIFLFFASTFWFISSSYIVIFHCVAFFFLSLHIPVSFLCFMILVCFHRFFYLHFQSNFPSWFWFFLQFFLGDTNFLIN